MLISPKKSEGFIHKKGDKACYRAARKSFLNKQKTAGVAKFIVNDYLMGARRVGKGDKENCKEIH